MRWSLGVVGLMVAAHAAAQRPAAGPATVTLDDAVRRSLQVQPAMVQALGNRRNAGAGRLAAWGSFIPSLLTNGSWSNNSSSLVQNGKAVGAGSSYSAGVSANVDIFDGFKRIGSLSAARANVTAADAGFVNQRFQTELQTKQAYFAALANAELVRAAQGQVARTEQELKAAADKLRVGAATRADSLTAAVDLGNAQVALLQAQANLVGAQATLGRQIGVDGEVQALPDTTVPVLPDTAALRQVAADNYPQVAQADALAHAAQAGMTVARSQYIPSLSVSYNTNVQGPSGDIFSNPQFSTWRVGLSWTLFNGFAREQSAVSARVTRDVAEATAADTRRSVSAQIIQEIAVLDAAYLQIQIAQSNVASATEALRVQQQKYQVGAGLLLDLLTSQANVTQAEVTLIQARFTYRTTRATLESLIGKEL